MFKLATDTTIVHFCNFLVFPLMFSYIAIVIPLFMLFYMCCLSVICMIQCCKKDVHTYFCEVGFIESCLCFLYEAFYLLPLIFSPVSNLLTKLLHKVVTVPQPICSWLYDYLDSIENHLVNLLGAYVCVFRYLYRGL